MRQRSRRYVDYGDRKHWEVTVGRTNVSRWCADEPCQDEVKGRHWLRLRRWARSWSRGDS